jgi:hypothetical protein
MSAPSTETIAVRFTKHERALLEGFAELRGMSASDLVRELIGFAPGQVAGRAALASAPHPEKGKPSGSLLPLGRPSS